MYYPMYYPKYMVWIIIIHYWIGFSTMIVAWDGINVFFLAHICLLLTYSWGLGSVNME